MARNPLRNEERSEVNPDSTTYTKVTRIRSVRIRQPDGTRRTVRISTGRSAPGANGNYIDSEKVSLEFDPAGNPLLPDLGDYALSHSGIIFTPTPENHALCESESHRGPNRHIYLGQDGSRLPDGRAFCSTCQVRQNNLTFAKVVLGAAAVIGILLSLFIGVNIR